MDTRQAYDLWSGQYDSDRNKTRDLEGFAMRATLEHIPFATCLEAGCGTGKNSEWLIRRCKELVAVDLSEGMLAIAREKYSQPGVRFVQADIRGEWSFVDGSSIWWRSAWCLNMLKIWITYSNRLLPGCIPADTSMWANCTLQAIHGNEGPL